MITANPSSESAASKAAHPSSTPVLGARDLRRAYGSTLALDGVDVYTALLSDVFSRKIVG